MARSFSGSEVKELIRKHNDRLNSLNQVIKNSSLLKNEIKKSADKFITQEIMVVLRGVSVDELNREKRGIRVKALHDNGVDTMADVIAMSRYNLASIYGISEDAAYTIKNLADKYARETQKNIKIKLSIDNKTKHASDLVIRVSKYKDYLPYARDAEHIIFDNKETIADLSKKASRGSNVIKWLFTSKTKKKDAEIAYQKLKEIYSTEYGRTCNTLLKESNDILKRTSTVAWNDFSKNSVQFYNILEETNPGLLGTDDVIFGLPEELAREIQGQAFFPDGLLCTLRRYQEWGVKYILHQERVLLGDEMGLGKTIQAIATMVSLRNTGETHFLVICPASVVTNWCREIVKHSKLRATKIYGSQRQSAFNSWKRTGGVAVTNFETTGHLKLEDGFKIGLVVVDEAHYIKNPGAQRTINALKLCKYSNRRLFMTGTALENKVDEMVELIGDLQPLIVRQIQGITFMSTAPQFREKVAPVYYRRKRNDVLTELPELVESEEWCTLGREEERIYEDAVLEKKYAEARRVSWNIDDLNKSCKANRLKEIVEEAEAEDRKVIVFSFFRDTIEKIHEFLGYRCSNPINGSVNVNRRQEIIDEFNDAPAGSVLLAQIQAGGTGLNIQAASVVVICEPQFKPSIENQAISRAYRMGQARNVLVYRLLCEDTVDEKLTDVLAEKQAIFDAFADKSVAAQQEQKEIDDTTFGAIINQEIERIKAKRGIKTDFGNDKVVTNDAKDVNVEPIIIKPASQYSYYLNSGLSHEEYYDRISKLSYNELVSLLLYKYGPAKYNYFTTETCAFKERKISRTSEWLYCHHIDEDKAIMLSNPDFARKNTFRYQMADRLVYSNFLEHLLLHIKIVEEPRNKDCNNGEQPGIGGAINFICPQINDFFNGYEYKRSDLVNATKLIENDYISYIKMLKQLWKAIESDHLLSSIYSKKDLCRGWEKQVISKIYND